jgi:hypothetical protein
MCILIDLNRRGHMQIGAMRERLAAARGEESRRASEFALRVMQERHVVEQQVCVCADVI